jgi:hypothetical protein
LPVVTSCGHQRWTRSEAISTESLLTIDYPMFDFWLGCDSKGFELAVTETATRLLNNLDLDL